MCPHIETSAMRYNDGAIEGLVSRFRHDSKGPAAGIRLQGRNHWGFGGFGPPKFGRTTPTFLMKSAITVT